MAKLSQNEQRRIRCLVARGWSQTKIAEDLGIDRRRIGEELKISRKLPSLQEQARRLLKQGFSREVIIANFGEVL